MDIDINQTRRLVYQRKTVEHHEQVEASTAGGNDLDHVSKDRPCMSKEAKEAYQPSHASSQHEEHLLSSLHTISQKCLSV